VAQDPTRLAVYPSDLLEAAWVVPHLSPTVQVRGKLPVRGGQSPPLAFHRLAQQRGRGLVLYGAGPTSPAAPAPRWRRRVRLARI
jgi:hypothetical protein